MRHVRQADQLFAEVLRLGQRGDGGEKHDNSFPAQALIQDASAQILSSGQQGALVLHN